PGESFTDAVVPSGPCPSFCQARKESLHGLWPQIPEAAEATSFDQRSEPPEVLSQRHCRDPSVALMDLVVGNVLVDRLLAMFSVRVHEARLTALKVSLQFGQLLASCCLVSAQRNALAPAIMCILGIPLFRAVLDLARSGSPLGDLAALGVEVAGNPGLDE